jgi:hypothetical protein
MIKHKIKSSARPLHHTREKKITIYRGIRSSHTPSNPHPSHPSYRLATNNSPPRVTRPAYRARLIPALPNQTGAGCERDG